MIKVKTGLVIKVKWFNDKSKRGLMIKLKTGLVIKVKKV